MYDVQENYPGFSDLAIAATAMASSPNYPHPPNARHFTALEVPVHNPFGNLP
jgi:hypothetical protein